MRGLGSAVARLSQHEPEWGVERVLDEGMDLVRDSTWADVSVLHRIAADGISVVARRPGAPSGPRLLQSRLTGTVAHAPGLPDSVPADWFPWGLAPVSPARFLLIDDAASLPVSPDGPTVGGLGMTSCLHLPILERNAPIGALHLYWSSPRIGWDDDQGRLLRTLGRYLLSAATR